MEPTLAQTVALRPQTRKVLSHLERRGTITPMEAQVTHAVFSLSSRIAELRKAGFPITKTLRKDEGGHRYARYTLNRKAA
jgi:hypothetical protein